MRFKYALTILLLTWALSATFLAIFFANLYFSTKERYTGIIYISIGINYGNGTLIWYNKTRALTGMSVYEVLLLVANVCANSGVYGVYVYEINGVRETSNCSWMYAVYNRYDVNAMATVDSWVYPGVSADRFIVKNNDIIVWVYFNWKKHWPPPLPTSRENLRT